MNVMRIALLEDDISQAAIIQRWLADAGVECQYSATGKAFRDSVTPDTADMVILDWMLPDDDGLQILAWLREKFGDALPVMFATSRGEEDALVTALDKGADDYLIKPLRRAELLARVNALARRGKAPQRDANITLGGVVLDNATHRALVNGTTVELTDREWLLAVYLLRNHGRLLTRQELLEKVWKTNPDIVTRTVDTHISRLRAKLALTPEHGFDLRTVYHRGYRLEYSAPSVA